MAEVWEGNDDGPGWYPPADVLETDAEYYLKLELSEVNKRGVRMNIDNGVLLLQGERKEQPTDCPFNQVFIIGFYW